MLIWMNRYIAHLARRRGCRDTGGGDCVSLCRSYIDVYLWSSPGALSSRRYPPPWTDLRCCGDIYYLLTYIYIHTYIYIYISIYLSFSCTWPLKLETVPPAVYRLKVLRRYLRIYTHTCISIDQSLYLSLSICCSWIHAYLSIYSSLSV